MGTYQRLFSERVGLRERLRARMTRMSTTRIGVKRIVIEVNRDLTAEQLEILDDTLKQLGLVKTTKVTLHNHEPHKPRPPRVSNQPTPIVGRSRIHIDGNH